MHQPTRWIPLSRLLVALCLPLLLFACRSQPDPVSPTPQPMSAATTETPASIGQEPVATPLPSASLVPTAEPLPEATTAGAEPLGEIGVAIEQMLSGAFEGQAFQGAVLVAQDGQVLLSRGYGLANREENLPNQPDTRFRIGSITKPFTALAILMLQQQERLHVQDALCDYLSACPTAWANITLHHLLTHTSGIPDLTHAPDFAQFATQPATSLAVLERFRDLPLDFAPGDRWDYSNSNYIVLGVVIEAAAQQSYADFMQTAIFGPLQMANSGYDHNLDSVAVGYRPNGAHADFIDMSVPFAAGALYASTADLYLWDRALRSDRLLSPALLEQMFTAHAAMQQRGADLSYGYGWILGSDARGRFGEHVGTINGFTGKVRRYLETDAMIIVLSNVEGANPNPIVERISALLSSTKAD